MDKLKNIFRQPEIHIFIFILGLLLLSWPILSIVDHKQNTALFIYLFLIWGVLIFLQWVIAKSLTSDGRDLPSEDASPEE